MTNANWALAQYRTSRGIATGIHVADRVLAAPPALGGLTVMELLRDWQRCAKVLRTLDLDALTPVEDAQLVAPLTYPNKVICAGANYYDHADEMGVDRPDPAVEPFFFLKTPTTTVVGPSAEVAIFDDGRSQVDWEAELGVVIGRRCADLAAADAADLLHTAFKRLYLDGSLQAAEEMAIEPLYMAAGEIRQKLSRLRLSQAPPDTEPLVE